MEKLDLNEGGEIKISPKNLSLGGKVLIGITGGIGVGLSAICLPFITPAFRKICLPYVPATDLQIQNVLAALRSCTGKILDIGSGDGRIVIAAAKENFIAHGVELNPYLVQYSRISAVLNGVQNKTSFFRKDLWKFNLRPYETIVIFGVEEMMEKFEEKLKNEVAAGTSVIACRFPLRSIEPVSMIGDGVDTVWHYRLK